jgi:hypothetical protein
MSVVRQLKVKNETGFDEAVDLGSKAENVTYTSYSWDVDAQDYSTPNQSTVQESLNLAESNIRNLTTEVDKWEPTISGLTEGYTDLREEVEQISGSLPDISDISVLETPIYFTETNIIDDIVLSLSSETTDDGESEAEPVVYADNEQEVFLALKRFLFYFSYAGHLQLPVQLRGSDFKGRLVSFDVLSETKNVKTTIQFTLSVPEVGKARIENVRTSTLSFDEENGVTFSVVDGLNELPLSLTEIVGTYY